MKPRVYAGTDLSIEAGQSIGLDQSVTASGGNITLNGRSIDLWTGALIAGIASEANFRASGIGAIDITASDAFSAASGSLC